MSDEHEESFFCRFTFGQFFAILLLEVFTLFFVFYLGARYGREFLGMPVQTDVASSSPAEPLVATTTDPEVTAMADELIAKAKTPDLKERIATMLNKEKTEEAIPPPLEDEAAGSDQPLGEISGPVRVKSGEVARYAVQVGSYPDLAQANAAIKLWKSKGYDTYIMIADIPDRGRWYRVRLGGFATHTDAEAYQHQLTDREGVDALVVVNEQ